jgi:hypothetical protein
MKMTQNIENMTHGLLEQFITAHSRKSGNYQTALIIINLIKTDPTARLTNITYERCLEGPTSKLDHNS